MSTPERPDPEVGMGVTMGIGTDRYPYTIYEVSENLKRIVVNKDNYKMVGGSAMSEHQKYEFEQVPPTKDSPGIILTLRKNGRWVRKGCPMNDSYRWYIGKRDAYRDPCF